MKEIGSGGFLHKGKWSREVQGLDERTYQEKVVRLLKAAVHATLMRIQPLGTTHRCRQGIISSNE
jgi:hypothetical protein